MLKLVVGYNSKEEEVEIARRVANDGEGENIKTVANKEQLFLLKEEVKKVYIDPEVENFIVDIVFATREPQDYGLEEIKDYIQYGASPRGTIDLYKASKALAYMRNRDYVTPVDVAIMAKSTLRHRIILSYEAEAENIKSDEIIEKVLESVPIP